MKIGELRPGMNNVEVEGKITEISDPRQIRTKFGTQITLTTAEIEDDTGSAKLTLWGEQSDGVEEGSVVHIKNGFTKEFKGELQISIGKRGTISIVS